MNMLFTGVIFAVTVLTTVETDHINLAYCFHRDREIDTNQFLNNGKVEFSLSQNAHLVIMHAGSNPFKIFGR